MKYSTGIRLNLLSTTGYVLPLIYIGAKKKLNAPEKWFKRLIPDEEPVLRGFHDNFNARKTWMKGLNSTVATMRLSTLMFDNRVPKIEDVLLGANAEKAEHPENTSDEQRKELIKEIDLSSIKI